MKILDFPSLIQTYKHDCGAKVLQAVFAYYGIDLNGEKIGFLPDPAWKEEVKNEAWYPGDSLHLAIGQGDLLVTPLQVAAYTSVIAAGGILYQPKLVEKIIDPATDN